MNFKMKALVAAVALTASMSASAAMTNTVSGDSSLILTLIDTTAKVSATFDLGDSNTSFDRNVNNEWNITSGDYASAWTSFWNAADAGSTSWTVTSGDKLQPTQLFTTLNSVTNVSATQMTSDMGVFDNYINNNNLIGNMQSVADGATFATQLDNSQQYAGTYLSSTGTWGTNANNYGNALGALDSTMSVYTFNYATSAGISKVAPTQYMTAGFNNYFSMSSNGALTYTAAAVTAVPEADSWAMLLAGLGLMGFIARRRTAA